MAVVRMRGAWQREAIHRLRTWRGEREFRYHPRARDVGPHLLDFLGDLGFLEKAVEGNLDDQVLSHVAEWT